MKTLTRTSFIHFVSNKRPIEEQFHALFRVQDRVPELWCPISGKRTRVKAWETTKAGTSLTLELPPHGSTFVVFQNASVPSDALQPAPDGERRAAVVSGPWDVTFATTGETVTMDALGSWTDDERESIRHYSGIARYRTEIQLPIEWLESGRKIELDLGDFWAVARVTLNGEPLGILWAPPYLVDLGKSARPGSNRLQIEVANTWANRLVGDSQLPEPQRRTRTNITGTGTPRVPWSDLPLRESGLFGPVRLIHTGSALNP